MSAQKYQPQSHRGTEPTDSTARREAARLAARWACVAGPRRRIDLCLCALTVFQLCVSVSLWFSYVDAIADSPLIAASRYDGQVRPQADHRPKLSVARADDFEVSGTGDHAAWRRVEWTALRR